MNYTQRVKQYIHNFTAITYKLVLGNYLVCTTNIKIYLNRPVSEFSNSQNLPVQTLSRPFPLYPAPLGDLNDPITNPL